MTALHQTEIDGVPTVWTPVAGPLRAALILRVGNADETFLTAGTSHLLEHLALFGLGRPGDHSNGFVDQTRTVFTVEGDDTEVTEFLGSLTRQLAEPPVHRLEAERGVIAAEQAGRGPGLLDQNLIWRYGAVDYGLAAMDQHGVRRAGPEDLTAWSRRFATRDNSVLWLSGPPPAGLRLHLPAGTARPAPDPRRSILPWSPSWFTGPDDRVTFDCLVTRGWAASALAGVLRGRMVDELRTRRAVAYSPDAHYQRLTGDTARLIGTSDLVAGRQSEGVRPALAMLERLSSGPDSPDAVQPGEVESWIAGTRRHALDPQHQLGVLDGAAWDVLHGLAPSDSEQMLAELAAVTAARITAAALEARDTLLAQIPHGAAPRGAWRPAPASQEPALSGRRYRSRDPERRATYTLVVGAEGITSIIGESHLSIPRASTVGVLHWKDGRRALVGADGSQLPVEPTMWENGDQLLVELDRIWPAELAVDLGTRPPGSIPRPADEPDARPARPDRPAGTGRPARRSLRQLAGELRWWLRTAPGMRALFALTVVLGVLLIVSSAVHNHGTTGVYAPSPVLAVFVGALAVRRYRVWRAWHGKP